MNPPHAALYFTCEGWPQDKSNILFPTAYLNQVACLESLVHFSLNLDYYVTIIPKIFSVVKNFFLQ